MPRGIGRLPFLHRRSGSPTGSSDTVAAAPERAIDLDAQPIGPMLLMPAAIIRQVLFEATELTPAWALPRATTTAAIVAPPTTAPIPTSVAPADAAPPVKRARRSTATGASTKPRKPAAKPDAPRPRRTRRTNGSGDA